MLWGVQWSDFYQVVNNSRLRIHYQKLKMERRKLDLRKHTSRRMVLNMWKGRLADEEIGRTVCLQYTVTTCYLIYSLSHCVDSDKFSGRNQSIGCDVAWVTIARASESGYPFNLVG